MVISSKIRRDLANLEKRSILPSGRIDRTNETLSSSMRNYNERASASLAFDIIVCVSEVGPHVSIKCDIQVISLDATRKMLRTYMCVCARLTLRKLGRK